MVDADTMSPRVAAVIIAECLAEDAVRRELVSAPKFPANRENNRESREKEPSSCHRQVKFARQFSDLGEEFPMAGTGNFSTARREFFHRNREIDRD